MPTEQNSTHENDSAQADHQSQQDDQNSKDHSGAPENKFDARQAFNATNERLNKVAAVVEKIDPDVIAQIAEKLGVSKKEAKEKVENQDQDATAIARQVAREELWNDQNAERITDADKNGAYKKYLGLGYKPDHALRLAEQDEGILVDTAPQKRQQRVSSAGSSIDRDEAPELTNDEAAYGITAEDKKKYGERAKHVQIIR